MTKASETLVFTADNKGIVALKETAHHSRDGYAIHRWLSEAMGVAGASVISTPSMIYDIPDGYATFITNMRCNLTTASDYAAFWMVACNVANCLDLTPTEISPHGHVYSDTAPAGTDDVEIIFDPPIRVRYSDGWRCVGMRVDTNDADARFKCSWSGWVEPE